MENKVTSLELSKKLKELGVKQESEFYWGDTHIDEPKLYTLKKMHVKSYKELPKRICSAFLSCELGERLPEEVVKGKLEISIYRELKYDGTLSKRYWKVRYRNAFVPIRYKVSMAEVMGLMLEYLIENKLIEL